jgi:glycosyltransferase involved in cell wall biosynthesis
MSARGTLGPVLLVSHVSPVPASAGNEVRLAKLLAWLRGEGWRTILLLNAQVPDPETLEAIRALVDDLHFVGEFQGRVEDGPSGAASLLEKVGMRLPVIGRRLEAQRIKGSLAPPALVEGTSILCREHAVRAVIVEYIFASPCLRAVPEGILTMIDTIDMFCLKKSQVLRHGIRDPFHCTRGEERRALLRAEVIIAIQEREAALFEALVPEREVISVGMDLDGTRSGAASPGGTAVLVVGSDNPLNIHGLRSFLAEAWPSIRRAHPESTLRVVGKLAGHVGAEGGGVVPVGWVPDLDEEYRRAGVVINPTVAGTGLKIKSVEALSRGKALVTTVNGADGLGPTGTIPCRVCGDWGSFAREVISLLDSEELRRELGERARIHAAERFSPARVYAPLAAALGRAKTGAGSTAGPVP